MKKSELKQIIREEYKRIMLRESEEALVGSTRIYGKTVDVYTDDEGNLYYYKYGRAVDLDSSDVDFFDENDEKNFLGEDVLPTFKKGEKVWRLMSRYNPQLGMYYVFQEETIEKVNSASVVCSDTNTYDKKTGQRKNKSTSVYGSADYEIMSYEDAKKKNSKLTSQGAKVRGLK